MIIVADTSAVFAAFDADQPEHEAAATVMEREMLALSPLVLTELDRLVQRDLGYPAVMQIMDALNARISDGRYRLAELRPVDLMAAHEVRDKHNGLRLDLTDAVGVILADRYRTNQIFTLDHRDYRAMAPLTAGFSSFHLLPADGS